MALVEIRVVVLHVAVHTDPLKEGSHEIVGLRIVLEDVVLRPVVVVLCEFLFASADNAVSIHDNTPPPRWLWISIPRMGERAMSFTCIYRFPRHLYTDAHLQVNGLTEAFGYT